MDRLFLVSCDFKHVVECLRDEFTVTFCLSGKKKSLPYVAKSIMLSERLGIACLSTGFKDIRKALKTIIKV